MENTIKHKRDNYLQRSPQNQWNNRAQNQIRRRWNNKFVIIMEDLMATTTIEFTISTVPTIDHHYGMKICTRLLTLINKNSEKCTSTDPVVYFGSEPGQMTGLVSECCMSEPSLSR